MSAAWKLILAAGMAAVLCACGNSAAEALPQEDSVPRDSLVLEEETSSEVPGTEEELAEEEGDADPEDRFGGETGPDEAAPDPMELYREVFDQYRQAKANGYNYDSDFEGLEQLPYVSLGHVYFVGPAVGEMSLSYTFFDIDRNGVEELLIADGPVIIDVFLHDGSRPVNPIEGAPCSFEDYPTKGLGPIIHSSGVLEVDYDVLSGGGHEYLRLDPGGGAAALLDAVSWERDGSTLSYFLGSPRNWMEYRQEISSGDYEAVLEQYAGDLFDSSSFQWTPMP